MIIRSGGQKSFVDGVHIYLPDRISLGQGETVDRLAYRVLTAENVGFQSLKHGLVLEDIKALAGPGEWLPLERCSILSTRSWPKIFSGSWNIGALKVRLGQNTRGGPSHG